MKRTLGLPLLISALTLMVGFSQLALAGTDTSQFQVEIVVMSTCDIHTTAPTNVNFGANPSTATNVTQTGTLTVNCTPGTPYNIGLDNGSNATGTQRRMLMGTANYVAYNLFQDSNISIPWGGTVGTNTLSGVGTGSNQGEPVYGVVPSANSPAGTYTDTVTATVTY